MWTVSDKVKLNIPKGSKLYVYIVWINHASRDYHTPMAELIAVSYDRKTAYKIRSNWIKDNRDKDWAYPEHVCVRRMKVSECIT